MTFRVVLEACRSRRTACGLRRVQLLVNGRDRGLVPAFPTGASPLALPLHLGVEAGAIDLQTELARHLFLLVDREAERVVQLER